MSKIKFLLCVLIFCVFSISCGSNKKPSGISDEVYQNAVYVVKATDLYLNGESTIEDAYKKIDSVKDTDAEVASEDWGIEVSIQSIKARCLGVKVGSNTLSDLKESRDELAKEINYKD
jgi:hypothetical protein